MAIPFINESSDVLDDIPKEAYYNNFYREGIEVAMETLTEEDVKEVLGNNNWLRQYPIDLYNIRNSMQNAVIAATKNPDPPKPAE